MRSRAAVAMAGILAVALSACGQSASHTPPPGWVASHRAGHFTDPSFGWSIRVAAGLGAYLFLSTERVTSDGVRVTSFPPDLRAPSNGTPSMGWLRSFPADGVAVQIWSDLGPVWAPPLRDSAFPLSPSSFRRTRPYVGGKEPHPQVSGFYGDGFPFAAAVWVGHEADRAERQAAWAVVRSLRFPALREGTIWHDTYYVLGRASRYPADSVTTFPASALPGSRSFLGVMSRRGFYLIHAPRAFYVITKVFQTQAPPSFKVFTCTVAFDPKAFQFFCPGTDLRWNRAGQPVGARAGGGQDWDLLLHVATVAQDGHVLFGPSWGGLLPVVLKGNPWG